ncbi:MAG: hypothetical protein HC869_21760 [Rhodospirillales bacterium]|nr:hypothetical protein [Rhodospirillales bacterium]
MQLISQPDQSAIDSCSFRKHSRAMHLAVAPTATCETVKMGKAAELCMNQPGVQGQRCVAAVGAHELLPAALHSERQFSFFLVYSEYSSSTAF